MLMILALMTCGTKKVPPLSTVLKAALLHVEFKPAQSGSQLSPGADHGNGPPVAG
jgi:hypothetical protein